MAVSPGQPGTDMFPALLDRFPERSPVPHPVRTYQNALSRYFVRQIQQYRLPLCLHSLSFITLHRTKCHARWAQFWAHASQIIAGRGISPEGISVFGSYVTKTLVSPQKSHLPLCLTSDLPASQSAARSLSLRGPRTCFRVIS